MVLRRMMNRFETLLRYSNCSPMADLRWPGVDAGTFVVVVVVAAPINHNSAQHYRSDPAYVGPVQVRRDCVRGDAVKGGRN